MVETLHESRPLTIAYLTSAYARAGDTFIRREVAQLRVMGMTVHTFSIRRQAGEEISDEVRREQEQTDYVMERGLGRLGLALLKETFTNPGGTLRAVRLAWSSRARGLKGTVWQLAYLMQAAYLAGRLRALKIEHVHNHIPANSAAVAMLASTMSGIPFSMTVHGPTVFYQPTELALATKIARASFTACISEFTRSQCRLLSDEAQADRLHVVRCGLDGEFLDAEITPLPATPRLVSVGRLCPEKGALVLIEAATRLAARGVVFELDFVGDGPSRPAIEAAIAAADLGDRVRLLGWRSSRGVREAIEQSWALVLPSFAEGLPVVIMEALALGRPVISTFVAGIPELVIPNENGALVPAGSTEALVDAIETLLAAGPERMAEMGRAGIARVSARHSIVLETARLAALIQQSARGAAANSEG